MPSITRLVSTARVFDRQLQSGEIGSPDVGSGLDPGLLSSRLSGRFGTFT